jgi:mRNA interferase MazF
VLSGAAINNKPIGLLMSVPITGTERGWPSHVEVGLGSTGLLKPSWAMAEQFRSISVQRLKRRLGYVDDTLLDRINVILGHLLRP